MTPLAATRGTRLVVVADLDGTLAFDGRPPGPATTAALEVILSHPDIRLVLASSRPPPAVHRLMGHLMTGADLVCCNGAVLVTSDGRSTRTSLAGSATASMVALLRDAGEEFCLDFGRWFLASSRAALPSWGDAERRLLVRHRRIPGGAVKLSVGDGARWQAALRRVAGPSVRLFPHAATGDLDVSPCGVTKASGLSRLLGGARPPVVALGNDVNDVEVLRAADQPFVVGSELRSLDNLLHTRRVAPADDAVAEVLCGAIETVGSLDRELTSSRR